MGLLCLCFLGGDWFGWFGWYVGWYGAHILNVCTQIHSRQPIPTNTTHPPTHLQKNKHVRRAQQPPLRPDLAAGAAPLRELREQGDLVFFGGGIVFCVCGLGCGDCDGVCVYFYGVGGVVGMGMGMGSSGRGCSRAWRCGWGRRGRSGRGSVPTRCGPTARGSCAAARTSTGR